MILSAVRITNFKQYAGEHPIVFSPTGLVAVIGQNGAGKTTLFEAIEWCLYGGKAVSKDNARTRDGGTPTMVEVDFEDLKTSTTWTVARRLTAGNSMTLVVRRTHGETSELVVEGVTPAEEYIKTTLIGLDYSAFTATYFTRQKELGWFSTKGATDRRELISKLLGQGMVKAAQDVLREQSKQAADTAKIVRARIDLDLGGIDFAANIAEAEAAEREAIAVRDERQRVHERLAAQLQDALSCMQEHERRKSEDDLLDRALLRNRSEHRAAVDGEQAIRLRIAQLQADIALLEGLDAEARALPQLSAEVEAILRVKNQVDEREKHLKRIVTLERQHAAKSAEVPTLRATAFPDATSTERVNHLDPEQDASALLAAIDALDLHAAQGRRESLTQLQHLADAVDAEQVKLNRYQERQAELLDIERSLLAQGDLEAHRGRLVDQVAVLTTALGELEADKRAQRATVEKSASIIAKLERLELDAQCDTCQRPFQPDEVGVLIATFRANKAGAEEREREAEQRISAAKRQREDLEAQAKQAEQLIEQLQDTRSRLETATGHIQAQEAAVEREERELQRLLAQLGLSTLPTAADHAAAETAIAQMEKAKSVRGAVAAVVSDLASIRRDRDGLREQVELLAAVHYDATKHAEVEAARDRASAAEGQARLIRRSEPELAEKIGEAAAAEARLAELAGEYRELEAQRTDLAFDHSALDQARTARDHAQELERTADGEVQAAGFAVQTASDRVEVAKAALRALEERIAEANTLQRTADELASVVTEMGEFDKYVVTKTAHLLGDKASDFLAVATDNRYSRLEFDENYTPRVFDGDRSFEHDQFSGGERDVIALSARLALSALIASRAPNPPRFAVLDEVFGSLDPDRRRNLLEMLKELVDSGESLRQAFLISHVEDVVHSPAIDEIWRVQVKHGSSTLEQSELFTDGQEEAEFGD